MNIVIVGHVDHGKSTIIGRLLADTNSLPNGKLQRIKQFCETNSKPFEYAFLLDALKNEQSQGITIDTARIFFKTKLRSYLFLDAPGHIEFLKNMVTGAAHAEAAILVIDANEGVQENSKRHAYLLSMLGVKQFVVLINKMDLVKYSEERFNKVVDEFQEFLSKIELFSIGFIPVSGREGDLIVSHSSRMDWYSGRTVIEMLDRFNEEKHKNEKPFRMPVQDIYKFGSNNDDRRIVAGRVESGSLKIGDEVVFYPSGKTGVIKTLEKFNSAKVTQVKAGESIGFRLEDQIYINRGEMATKAGEVTPEVSKIIQANIFWLGNEPLIANKEYFLKLGTKKVSFYLLDVKRTINASSLTIENNNKNIKKNEVAEVTLKLSDVISFDLYHQIDTTNRFVIVDGYEVSGGGIITKSIKDKHSKIRNDVILRNYKWGRSKISSERRAEKYNQKPLLILITGAEGSGRKEIAKTIEEMLFNKGKFVYFLPLGSVKYGVDTDISREDYSNDFEHIRRLAEIAHILLDSGVILIITARNLTQNDLDIFTTIIDSNLIEMVFVGNKTENSISFDVYLPGINDIVYSVEKLFAELQKKGTLYL